MTAAREVAWLPRLAIGVAVVAVFYFFRGLIVPLAGAAIVAYLLNPLIGWGESFGIRRGLAVAGLFLGLLGGVVAGGYVLGPRLGTEAVALAQRLPTLAAEADAALDVAERALTEAFPAVRRVLPGGEARQRWVDRFLDGQVGDASRLVQHAGRLFIFAILLPFFTFFLLRDSRRLIAFVMDRIPPVHVETTVAVWCEIDRIIGQYVRGLALDGLVVGTLVTLSLWMLGVPYPIFLGAFAGLANAIPVVGPILGAGAAGLVALIHGQGFGAVGRILLLLLAIRALDDAVIQPVTIGRSVHLHPLLLATSIIAGNEALGILGMIVAVPCVTVLQETARLLLEHRRTLARRVPVTSPAPTRPHLVH